MTHVFHEIPLTKQEVLACSYSAWQPVLSEYTYPAEVIKPLPKAFLDYLAADSIMLPGDGSVSEKEENDQNGKEKSPEFAALHQQIARVLQEYSVLPKLNWSSPKDAKWIAAGSTMRCRVPEDVYLLLKASDHIADDLDAPFGEVKQNEETEKEVDFSYELVLKKWVDINPSLEFRVFVHNRRVVGISQRELNHYEFLHGIKDDVVAAIDAFVEESHVLTKFPVANFIMDLYVPRPYKKVKVLDVNPFSRKCDSLLFTWHELLEGTKSELRLVDKNNIGRFAKKEYSESQVPIEVVKAGANGGEDLAELAREWMRNPSSDTED